ncbi:N-acetylmuramoyl-L-alanine amidase [Oceanobacillus bengalensis]|nr:N-acetylmuramoyl-L-alanine amidase [Oceanobacillus bengalensis]
MHKKIFLITSMLMILVYPFTGNIAYATEYYSQGNLDEGSNYYFIHYDGEEQKVTIEKNIILFLTGWTDETNSAVNGKIEIQDDSSNLTKDIILKVTNERSEMVVISEDETIHYRLAESDSFKFEEIQPLELNNQITVVAENENGTSIEEVKTVDEYDTVINQGLAYYSIDENNEKIKITEEEYDSLNAVVEEESKDNFSEQKSSENEEKSSEEKPTKETLTASEDHPEELLMKKSLKVSLEENPSINYATHVQGDSWQDPVSNGETSGTKGQAKRLEAIKISIGNIQDLGVKYATHVQSDGWLDYVPGGEISGTTGKHKRLEAIKIELTGKKAKDYDIYYRVHAQTFGWLDWAKNGEPAGTEGLSKRLEAIEIKLVKKGGNAPGPTAEPFLTEPSIVYSTHVQTSGWIDFVADGAISGTKGQAKRLESIKIDLKDTPYSGGVTYSTHVQSKGWLNNASNGNQSGTTGESKRMEAIKISLTGDIAKHYDIYYRVHSQTFGWLDWAKNGEKAGTEGLSKRLEAIEIELVEKDGKAPGSTSKPFLTNPSVVYSTHVQSHGWMDFVADGAMSGTKGQAKRLEAININLEHAPYSGDIVYSTHVQSRGWLSNVSDGDISGTSGQSKRMEAIKINLTGEISKYYDVYYRVHIQGYGWLGWAKNGMRAGSEGQSKRLEAIEIKLVTKGKGATVNEGEAFKQPKTVFLDPGHGGSDSGATAGGFHEADLNLSVAKKVQKLLQDRGFNVYMSRTNDSYLSLLERSKKANALNADIFVSIHHNSGVSTANGIESYYYKYDKNYPSKINKDMHNNPKRVLNSMSLTNLINRNMVSYTGAYNRGTYGKTFAVLRESAMPATLLELGFISNPSERRKLVVDAYQNKLAKAIADGIDEYFKIN